MLDLISFTIHISYYFFPTFSALSGSVATSMLTQVVTDKLSDESLFFFYSKKCFKVIYDMGNNADWYWRYWSLLVLLILFITCLFFVYNLVWCCYFEFTRRSSDWKIAWRNFLIYFWMSYFQLLLGTRTIY